MLKRAAPGPFEDDPAWMVIHGTSVEAVHSHPGIVATEMLPEAPAAETVALDRSIVKRQAAGSWRI
jgi:hypothetical protein